MQCNALSIFSKPIFFQGCGGPINTILSSPVFIPLARISYCLYLVHLTVIMWVNSQPSYSVSFNLLLGIYSFFGNILICIGVAFVMVIVFEAPILHMEKLLFSLLGLASMPPVFGSNPYSKINE